MGFVIIQSYYWTREPLIYLIVRMAILAYWEVDQFDNRHFAGALLDIYGVQPFMVKRRHISSPNGSMLFFVLDLFDNSTSTTATPS